MKNPYKIGTTNSRQSRVSNNALKLVNKHKKNLQNISNAKFGKDKFKVSKAYALDHLLGVNR